MYTLKSKIKILTASSFIICYCTFINAQDYYGGTGSWRKQQNAQNQQPKDKDNSGEEPSGYISINYGFASPMGSFSQYYSQNGFTYPQQGIGYGNYATPGNVFHFSLGIPINHSNFGIALMFASYTNQYDINGYVASLNNSPIGYNAYSNSPITGYASGGGQNVYSASSILGGLFYTYPVGRFSFDGRFMIGALLSSLPEQAVYAGDADGNQMFYDVEPSNATSFAFDLGAGIRFKLADLGSRKICLMANVDYLYSEASYNTQQDIYVVPASGTYANQEVQLLPSPTVSGKLPIQLLNITFGIGYQL